MITEALRELLKGNDLGAELAEKVMTEIMEGKATDAQIGAFLTALRIKGETVEEISAFAKIMRAKAQRIELKAGVLMDTCGTGGDSAHTFNISTAVALVLAACGVSIAKHGNRSVSSKCGSADVLESLGVKIELEPERVKESIEKVGIGFMFAPSFHRAMKYAIGPRREIAIRTVFNILGPLTNPAGARYQLLGVYDPGLSNSLARVLKNLGSKAAMVVHGDGLDEVTTTGVTKISELKTDGSLDDYQIEPQDYGLDKATLADLQCGSLEENVETMKLVLGGSIGPKTDIVLLNSGCALKVAQKTDSIAAGMEMAKEVLQSGQALKKLEQLVEFSNA